MNTVQSNKIRITRVENQITYKQLRIVDGLVEDRKVNVGRITHTGNSRIKFGTKNRTFYSKLQRNDVSLKQEGFDFNLQFIIH